MRKTANTKLTELEEKPEHRPLTRAKRQTRHEQWREWHACLQAALVCRASLLALIDLLAKPSALLVYAHPTPGHLPPSSSLQALTPEQSAKLVSKAANFAVSLCKNDWMHPHPIVWHGFRPNLSDMY